MRCKIVLIISLLFSFSACKKEDKVFTFKTIQLNHYSPKEIPKQLLSLKVLEDDHMTVIAETEKYPSEYTLPAQFAVQPQLSLPLYAQKYSIQLWGDVTGFLGECEVDMHHYKIVFPIDMEVDSESLGVSIKGSWQ